MNQHPDTTHIHIFAPSVSTNTDFMGESLYVISGEPVQSRIRNSATSLILLWENLQQNNQLIYDKEFCLSYPNLAPVSDQGYAEIRLLSL